MGLLRNLQWNSCQLDQEKKSPSRMVWRVLALVPLALLVALFQAPTGCRGGGSCRGLGRETQLSLAVKKRRTVNTTKLVMHSHDQETPSCRRKCDSYDNKIVFRGRKAGIVDREGVLYSLSNIAGYLCAKLHINSAEKNLQTAHNLGRPTPADLRLEHLVNITLIERGQAAFEEMAVDPTNVTGWEVSISTGDPTRGVPGFLAAEQAVANNRSFVWEIGPGANYYRWSEALFVHLEGRTNATLEPEDPPRRGVSTPSHPTSLPFLDNSVGTFLGCPYATLSSPHPIQLTAERVYRNLTGSSSSMMVGYLHIRQGDVAWACPTGADELRRYLTCSLNHTDALGNVTLLFSSDMRNETERQLWRDIGASVYPHVRLFDLDALVQLDLEQQVAAGAPPYYLTTFYVFQVVREIKRKAAWRWQRRKQICAPCDVVPAHVFEGKPATGVLSLYGRFS